MSASVEMPEPLLVRPKQNWVLGPVPDLLFIIATPLLAFAWAAVVFVNFGSAMVVSIFVVFNVAHHLPTFIRIYGDRDLLARFRWSLLLGPVLPFSMAMLAVYYVIRSDFPVENVMCLGLILTVWDPWHFFMQHYGFMRIYDGNNRAPRKLASRMDMLLCASWFLMVMLGAVHWMPDLLYDIQCNHGIPLLRLFGSGAYVALEQLVLVTVVISSIAYLVYLRWCAVQGFFISWAKLLLFVITFGVMYLAYVPNAVVQQVLPGWNFPMGFAALGMVHVSQYLAIVWKYNRSLATDKDHARPGLFRTTFARGGVLVVFGYVACCLGYGYVLSPYRFGSILPAMTVETSQWIVGTLIALSFTSTLLHYYYDGFIWKVRNKENQRHLAMQQSPDPADPYTTSWWDTHRHSPVLATILRQGLYFGLPILLVTVSYWMVKQDPLADPVQQVQRAIELNEGEFIDQSVQEARLAIVGINKQLEIERRMIEIRPRALHFTYVADLVYLKSLTANRLIYRADPATDAEARSRHRRAVAKAIDSLEKAMVSSGPFGHRRSPDMRREDAESLLASRRRELDELDR
jgi:hypothetical protein